jgi:hypothetical protein
VQSVCRHAFHARIRLQTHTSSSPETFLIRVPLDACRSLRSSKRTMAWFVIIHVGCHFGSLSKLVTMLVKLICSQACYYSLWATLSILSIVTFISISSQIRSNPCPVWDFFISKNPYSVPKISKNSRCLWPDNACPNSICRCHPRRHRNILFHLCGLL